MQALFICAVLIATLSQGQGSTPAPPPSSCTATPETRIVKVGNTCYHFGIFNSMGNANEAKNFCNRLGMTLAAFETDEEYNSVKSKMPVVRADYWTSGKCTAGSACTWEGTSDTFPGSKLAVGYPQRQGRNVCVVLSKTLSNKELQGVVCDYRAFYLCEKRL